jgi:ribosomal protein RSM22 (predicted rRNA methylase)
MFLFTKYFRQRRTFSSAVIRTFFFLPRCAIFLIFPILLSGCSRHSYKEYARAHHMATKAEAEAKAQMFSTAFQAVQELCKVFDQAAIKKEQKSPIMTREIIDVEGNPVIDTVFFPPQDTGTTLLLAGVAKSMVLREIYPLIKEITHEMTNKLERPVTVEEVMLKVADETGLIAVIGGMYGLGKQGIKNAGAALNNVGVDNGAALGVGEPGTQSGNSNPWTDNHIE